MQNNILMIILWLVCGVATVITAVLASRSRQARYTGRAAVGVPFIIGGALLHVVNLATGGDYAGFADPSHFAWVTHTWNVVVVPNHILLIGLLAVLEATAGVLTLSGGRKTPARLSGRDRVLPSSVAIRADRDSMGPHHAPGDAASAAG